MLTLDAILTPGNAPLTAFAAVLAFQVASWIYGYVTMPAEQKNAKKLKRMPGSLPFFWDTFTILRNSERLYDLHLENAKRNNGVSTEWKILGRPPIIELVTPQQIEDVQKTYNDCFIKGEYMLTGLHDLLGDGIFNVDGASWVHQRKTSVNLFTTRILRDQMAKTMYRLLGVVQGLMQTACDEGELYDLTDMLNKFTIQAFAENGFGIDFNTLGKKEQHPFTEAFDRSQHILLQRFMRPRWFWTFQRWANLGIEAELRTHLKVINDMVYDVISKSLEERNKAAATKITGGEKKLDIISLFLDNQKTLPDGTIEAFDPKFLRDITINFLGAARDTTSVSLSWFFYALMNHPEVECKLRKEMNEKLPELMSGKITAPSMDMISDLVYLDAVVKEVLRLYPPVASDIRMCQKSVVLSDGTYVPEGTTAAFQNYTLGKMTYIWGPDAEEFKPERWMDEATGKVKAISVYQFNAFLAGPRICIGMQLALMQIKMVATSLLSRFHLDYANKEPMTYKMALLYVMKDPLMVRVRPAASFT